VRPSVVAAQRYHAATFIVRHPSHQRICRIGVMKALNRNVERVSRRSGSVRNCGSARSVLKELRRRDRPASLAFGIPYKLKQWFDLIVQPGLTFRFDPAQGYLPLLKDRPESATGNGWPLTQDG
jgi:hypothetical protein